MDNNFMMLLPMLMGGNNSNMGDLLKMMGGQNQDPMMTAMMSMLNKNKGNTNPQNINDINPNDNTHQNNINDNNGVKTDANTVVGNGFAPIKDISGETIMELMRIFLNLKTN